MSQLRFSNGYGQLTDAKLLETAYFIWQQVSTRTSVFPTPTPTMTIFKDAYDNFQSALNAALSGDRVLGEQKREARRSLIKLLYQLGHYVLMTANQDRLVALELGFTLAKEPPPAIIGKPANLKVGIPSQQGELLVSVDKVKGAASYMYQYTTDPELKEESWMTMNCTQAKCKLAGLTPGTVYYIRVGVVGKKDQVMYSDVVSKMAA